MDLKFHSRIEKYLVKQNGLLLIRKPYSVYTSEELIALSNILKNMNMLHFSYIYEHILYENSFTNILNVSSNDAHLL